MPQLMTHLTDADKQALAEPLNRGKPTAPDLAKQLAAMISIWRGTANDCKLMGSPDMLVTAQALENCADQAEKLISPPSAQPCS